MTEVDPDNEARFDVLVITGEPKQLRVPKEAIIRELKRCKYSQQAVFGVKLALEEALSNALKHGNQGDASKTITVRYSVDEQRAMVIVGDEGRGFVPENVPDPTTPDRLPLPSGRGIMLISAYMDEVEYRDHGREVYFVKKREQSPGPS
jgi:serine/threonine-protein kinase RsbW